MSKRAPAKLRRIISRNAADDAANSKPEKLLINLHNSLKSHGSRLIQLHSASQSHPSRRPSCVQVAYPSHFSFAGEGREGATERRTFLKKLINEMLINFCQPVEPGWVELSRVDLVAWYRGRLADQRPRQPRVVAPQGVTSLRRLRFMSWHLSWQRVNKRWA